MKTNLDLALSTASTARELGVSLFHPATAQSCSTPVPPNAARAGTIRRWSKAVETLANFEIGQAA